MKRYGIISDTHGLFHEEIHQHFSGVDAILHGGDVVSDTVIKRLKIMAPTYAVAGNCDAKTVELPIRRVVELPFGNVGIAHGHLFSGRLEKRIQELLEDFAEDDVRLIVTGHSHSQLLDFRKNTFIINPGAACKPRFNLQSSLCVVSWDEDTNTLAFQFFIPLVWKKK